MALVPTLMNAPAAAQNDPDIYARRRAVAEAMMQGGGDYSPAGSWTQGIARIASGIEGGMQQHHLNQMWAAQQQPTPAPGMPLPVARPWMPANGS